VTNAIVHGYGGSGKGTVYLSAEIYPDRTVRITVRDKGKGIEDVALARRPLYTTDTSGERSGMGFSVMESFTDRLRVHSKPGRGTRITMIKRLT
jgi:stage II sporulation protein AB (anti-sigma F factor)